MNGGVPRIPAAQRHPHGTVGKYGYGCRCDACREAKRLWSRDYYRKRAAAAGISRVDVGQVQQHVQRLMATGMGARSIADASGLDRKTVVDVAHGTRARVTRRTAFRLLRVHIDQAADHVLVDATHTWTLIRELVEEGYTMKALAGMLGYRGKTIPFGRKRCSVRNANRLRVLHASLTSDAAIPVPRTRPYHSPNRIYMQHARSAP